MTTTPSTYDPPRGPCDPEIGSMDDHPPMPRIGQRVRTRPDQNRPDAEPRYGVVIGHAVTHYPPRYSDDPDTVHMLAVVALDIDQGGWLTRDGFGRRDTEARDCYVSTIVADPYSLDVDTDRDAPSPWRHRADGWGLPHHLAD
jgi:hypothetical protein